MLPFFSVVLDTDFAAVSKRIQVVASTPGIQSKWSLWLLSTTAALTLLCQISVCALSGAVALRVIASFKKIMNFKIKGNVIKVLAKVLQASHELVRWLSPCRPFNGYKCSRATIMLSLCFSRYTVWIWILVFILKHEQSTEVCDVGEKPLGVCGVQLCNHYGRLPVQRIAVISHCMTSTYISYSPSSWNTWWVCFIWTCTDQQAFPRADDETSSP